MVDKIRMKDDAFGHALWAHYKGQESFQILERDDGYIDCINTKSYFTVYDEWPPLEKKVLKSVRGRVLDIGCGAGRIALYLQDQGFDVTGIDISPLAIKICKMRGLKKAKVMPIRETKFDSNSFDTILMMGNTFGLASNATGTQKILIEFYRITAADALIVTTTRDPYKTLNPVHLEYHKSNRRKGRMSGQVKLRERFQQHTSKWFDLLMVSKEEMRTILKDTGWEARDFIDSDGAGYAALLMKTREYSSIQDIEDNLLKKLEEKTQARLRTRGPYRKAIIANDHT